MPKGLELSHLGDETYNNQGLLMRVIAYRRYKDIDVLFPADGFVKTGVSYQTFKNGSILDPNVAVDPRLVVCARRIGERGFNAASGLGMVIIAYRGANDIDVRFDDGIIVRNKSYENFQKGFIRHPCCPVSGSDRVGLKNMNSQGVMMEIVAYRNSRDIDVRFEDQYGTVVEHTNFRNFLKGQIRNPNRRTFYGVGYIGQGPYDGVNAKKAFAVWRNMLCRCYNLLDMNYGNYGGRGVYVAHEWHNFQVFARWYMDRNPDSTMNLDVDKDFNGGTHYGPDVCIVIPHELNLTLVGFHKYRESGLPTGVISHKGRFRVAVGCGKNLFFCKTYNTVDEARFVYLMKKGRVYRGIGVRVECSVVGRGQEGRRRLL